MATHPPPPPLPYEYGKSRILKVHPLSMSDIGIFQVSTEVNIAALIRSFEQHMLSKLLRLTFAGVAHNQEYEFNGHSDTHRWHFWLEWLRSDGIYEYAAESTCIYPMEWLFVAVFWRRQHHNVLCRMFSRWRWKDRQSNSCTSLSVLSVHILPQSVLQSCIFTATSPPVALQSGHNTTVWLYVCCPVQIGSQKAVQEVHGD